MDLAYNVVKNGTKVTNPAFMKIVEVAKLDKPLNPNLVAKIAKSYGIPADIAVQVMEDAQYGITNKPVTTQATPVALSKQLIAPPIKPPVREGFYPPQKVSSKKLVCGIAIALLAIVLLWLLYSKFFKTKRTASFHF
jgi:hypothetical protein